MPNGNAATKASELADRRQRSNWNVSCHTKQQQKREERHGAISNSNLVTKKIQDEDEDVAQQPPEQQGRLTANRTAVSFVDGSSVTLYPAYTFFSSPTYLKWVNLTAHEIHQSLDIREGFSHSWLSTGFKHGRDTPQLVFYLNHPIQFVQIVGVVVNFEEYFEWFWLFTVDDSSGSTIDVICSKPEKKKPVQVGQAAVEDIDEKAEQEQITSLSNQVASSVQIGAVLQVKGIITLFQRNKPAELLTGVGASYRHQKQEQPTRQITLQRLSVVHDTNQELNLIAARTKFHREILNKAWILTPKEQHRLHRRALGEGEHERKRAKRHADKKRKLEEDEQGDAEQILREYEAEEVERETEANRARQAGAELNAKKRAMYEKHAAQVATGSESLEKQTVAQQPALSQQPDKAVAKKEKRKKQKGERNPHVSVNHSNLVSRHEDLSSRKDNNQEHDEKSILLRAAFGT